MDRTGSPGSSTVIDFTGPQRVLEDPEPLVTGHRARHGDRQDDTPDEPASARRTVARHSHEAEPDDAATTSGSRRRVNWRKGNDVDEELWPAEAFGGVSDEQFWDDLAADKPLATTARTAQPDTAAKRRPGPLPDLYPGDDRGRGDGRRGSAEGPGTHPQPRLAPGDRTAIQPVATSPVATQAYPTAAQAYPTAAQPYPTAAQPSPAATQPVRAAQQPAESRGRSRAAISADEDPLTSPAYSLRPKGSVDGHSYPSSRRSRDLSREQYESAIGQETQTFSLADAQAAGGGYPDGGRPVRQSDRPSYSVNGRGRPDAVRSDPLRSDPLRTDGYRSDPLRSDPLRSDPLRSDPLRSDPLRSDPVRPDPVRPDPLRSGDAYGGTVPNTPYAPNVPSTAYPYAQQPYGEPTQSMNAPPYGESYGYGHPAGPSGDPRRANGGWSPGRAGGNGTGDGSWGSRPEYPPVNGYRGPYDPRANDRRLTSLP